MRQGPFGVSNKTHVSTIQNGWRLKASYGFLHPTMILTKAFLLAIDKLSEASAPVVIDQPLILQGPEWSTQSGVPRLPTPKS